MALEQYLREKLTSRSLLLMTHTVVGYPSLDDNWRMLECMQEAGIDLVELQLPFSEPIADGPMFIKANQLALDHGLQWEQYFDFATRASSEFDFPILFMGYYNSVLSRSAVRTRASPYFAVPALQQFQTDAGPAAYLDQHRTLPREQWVMIVNRRQRRAARGLDEDAMLVEVTFAGIDRLPVRDDTVVISCSRKNQ